MTCGYVCPQCEGSGVMENGDDCDYCTKPPASMQVKNKLDNVPGELTVEPINKEGIAHFENIHIIFWLIKDSCWMMGWVFGGTFMVIPTILMAVFISWKTRQNSLVLLPNLAVLCWICANSVWMFTEFFQLEIRALAIFFFASGILIILFYFYQILVKNKKLF